MDIEARTCRSRGTHIVCTRTYNDEGARKKIRPRMNIRAGSRTPTHAYVRPGLVYMDGSERRNNVVVVFMGRQRNASCSRGGNEMLVFMGRQRNASCSSGGNGTRGSQPAGSERNAWSCSSGGLGWNMQWKRGLAYRTTEETDLLHSEWGPFDREGCGVSQKGQNRPPTVETGVLLIGTGVAYRKTDETELLRSKRGSC